MVRVRIGSDADREAVQRLYAETDYRGAATPDAVIFLAEDDKRLVGIVRIEVEEHVKVLRGMRVVHDRQRQGIGTTLLRALNTHLDGLSCYCIAYTHLLGFYGQIGFEKIPAASAPQHLQDRSLEYRDIGLDVTLMRKAPRDV